MSRIGFSANTQTIFILALISNEPQLRDAVVQKEHLHNPLSRKDPEIVIRSYLDSMLYPLQDSVYGPVYTRLMAYSIDQIEFHLVDWSLRADQAVFFQEDHAPKKSKQTEADVVLSNEETTVFWDALTRSDHLLSQLKWLSRECVQNVRRAARILRAHVKLHSPTLVRSPFIIQAFLGMSLERINWIELAAQVLGIPVPEQLPLKREEFEEHDPHVQLAILQERLLQSQNDFGEYLRESWCSQDTQEVCVELSDQCSQAWQKMRGLKEQGRVFEQ